MLVNDEPKYLFYMYISNNILIFYKYIIRI